MASELSTTTITENNDNNNKVHQFVSEVEAHKRILETSTNLFTNLSNHYSSLLNSLSEKSKSIDSKLQSLQFNSTETLDSLLQDENSIPERESAAVVLIEEQKEAALAELQKPIPGNIDISAVLKSICRRMDSTALVRFIVSKRKESALLRSKISTALAEAVDAPKLVLEAVEDFLNSKSVRSGATDKRWACGILIQAMVPESGTKGVKFSRRIAERALRVVERWKEQMDGESGSAAEAVMFLQMVMCFGLRNRFDEEYLRKSVMQFPSRRDMAKLAATLEFGDKMIDIIDELVKNGKEVEAVYFASESGLTERFPPVDLLKSFIRNCRKNTSALLKKGNNRQDDTYTELNSTKALIKCVEDFKLESEINLDSLRRRITQLEKNMGDRRKSSASGSKPPYKQAYGSGRKRGCRGSGSSRSEKSARYSSYPSSSPSSFSRRNIAPSLQPSPATRYSAPYNYPSQTIYDGTIYDGSTANPYAATYGTSHIQTPAGLQQHYSVPVDNLASSAYPSTSSYATGQTGYGGMYDYGNAVPLSYPNQNSYMG